jgi:hypothetical protein
MSMFSAVKVMISTAKKKKKKKKVKSHSFTEIQRPRLELAAADQLQ